MPLPFSVGPCLQGKHAPNPKCYLSNKTAVTLIIFQCLHLSEKFACTALPYLCFSSHFMVSGSSKEFPTELPAPKQKEPGGETAHRWVSSMEGLLLLCIADVFHTKPDRAQKPEEH